MQQLLQEFVSSRGVDVRVDRDAGIIRGVKLLGLESRNGRHYLPAALQQAATLYEGAKVNVNHPKGSPLAARDYQDRLGAIRNVRHAAEGLFGDLHFNPKHTLAEQLAWDAEHAPENVGFSHNVEARTARRDGRIVVEAITKVQSVDLVADPATTQGLYESAEPTVPVASLTVELLRELRPDLVEQIVAENAAEVAELRDQLARLQDESDSRGKLEAVRALFREYGLPDPDSAQPAERLLAGRQFFEAVAAAGDEPAMRRLVEERAALLAAARRQGDSRSVLAPQSREQQRGQSLAPVHDALSFARAIR